MNLLDSYYAAVNQGDIQDDVLQHAVLADLQRVSDALNQRSWLSCVTQKYIQGIYLYGPVGVGKTWCVDLFYQSVSCPNKSRFHFHHFMQQIDSELRRLQGQKDPLRRIAATLAKSTRLLCLDEFLIHDVADAMILSELLQALFSHHVVLVAATNTHPDDLYSGGVHRERFLPAIDLIKQHCKILLLNNARDYRMGREHLIQAYVYPLDKTADTVLSQQFIAIDNTIHEAVELTVQKRQIPCIKCSERAVWFEFDVICNIPRSQLDYLDIAERFDTVFVSNITSLTRDETSRVIMLIHFVDVMYDRGIRLVVSAAVPAAQLYPEGPMIKSFQRTLSRLEEMQSIDYLKRHQRRFIRDFIHE